LLLVATLIGVFSIMAFTQEQRRLQVQAEKLAEDAPAASGSGFATKLRSCGLRMAGEGGCGAWSKRTTITTADKPAAPCDDAYMFRLVRHFWACPRPSCVGLTLVTFIVFCMTGTLLLLLLIGGRVLWQGQAALEVQVKSQKGRKIAKVSFDSLMTRQWADDFRKHPDEFELSLHPVEDFEGARGTVYVRTFGSGRAFIPDRRYVQDELLVLEVVYADGEKRLELAEVPERGQPQVIRLTIP
jgi:hypothetical protein